MPWFPDFTAAVESARRDTRAAGQADPVTQYFNALNDGDTRTLETIWPGEVVVFDPLAGEVRGHRQLRRFVHHNQTWLAECHARSETMASTVENGRAVVELLAHLVAHDGQQIEWPIAVVAESPNDRSVVFRTYCRHWPVDEPRLVRPPILQPARTDLGGVVGRLHAALSAANVEAVVAAFAPDGYFREPIGPHSVHRGATELRSFFTKVFSAGGGIALDPCAVTDDGVRCAVEYNCVGWGDHALPPQAGLAVYERSPDGLLAAARFYDEVKPPYEDA
jgi:ketosteroid isomerase-like protein